MSQPTVDIQLGVDAQPVADEQPSKQPSKPRTIGLPLPGTQVNVLQTGTLTSVVTGTLNPALEFASNVPAGQYQVCIQPPIGWGSKVRTTHVLAGELDDAQALAQRARIVLLAARERGYRSLMRLNSRAFLESPSHERPHAKIAWLERATSSHDSVKPNSPMPTTLGAMIGFHGGLDLALRRSARRDQGHEDFGAIAKALIAGGRDEQTPVAAVRWGTRPNQRTIRATLATASSTKNSAPSREVRRGAEIELLVLDLGGDLFQLFK